MSDAEVKKYITSLTVWCEDDLATVVVADGLGSAFVGLTNDGPPRAIYSLDRVIDQLEADMSRAEALEYFEFNILGACGGPRCPIFIHTPPTK